MTCVSAMLIAIITDFSSLVVGESNESFSGKKIKILTSFWMPYDRTIIWFLLFVKCKFCDFKGPAKCA